MRPDRAGGVITPPALFFYPRSALRILPKTYAERRAKSGKITVLSICVKNAKIVLQFPGL